MKTQSKYRQADPFLKSFLDFTDKCTNLVIYYILFCIVLFLIGPFLPTTWQNINIFFVCLGILVLIIALESVLNYIFRTLYTKPVFNDHSLYYHYIPAPPRDNRLRYTNYYAYSYEIYSDYPAILFCIAQHGLTNSGSYTLSINTPYKGKKKKTLYFLPRHCKESHIASFCKDFKMRLKNFSSEELHRRNIFYTDEIPLAPRLSSQKDASDLDGAGFIEYLPEDKIMRITVYHSNSCIHGNFLPIIPFNNLASHIRTLPGDLKEILRVIDYCYDEFKKSPQDNS